MKWLIYGGNGWIGTQLKSYLDASIEAIDGISRASDWNGIEAEIEQYHPDRIISMIGRTSGPGYSTIDYLEQSGKLIENLTDNLYGPMVLGEICRRHQIHFTYLGTGCIFSYSESPETFSESDQPNFFGSSYSAVKGITDQWFHHFNVLNVRIRMPIVASPHPKNFLSKILAYPKIYSTVNSMTVLPDVLPLLVSMILNQEVGTVHLVNPGPLSHNQILTLYRELVDPTKIWESISETEHNQILLSKRSKCVLNSALELPTLEQSIRKIFSSWSKV